MSRKGSVALIVASSGDVLMATPSTVVVYQSFQRDFLSETNSCLRMAVDEAWAVPVHMGEVALRLRTPRVRRRELPQSGPRFASLRLRRRDLFELADWRDDAMRDRWLQGCYIH